MKDAYILIIPFAVVFTLLMLRWKVGRDRALLENYLGANGIDCQVEQWNIPPIRLWLKNRKGDSWYKVRFPDGAVRWARVRNSWLATGNKVEFFV